VKFLKEALSLVPKEKYILATPAARGVVKIQISMKKAYNIIFVMLYAPYRFRISMI
jgi:hypothetical protein